MRVIVEDQGESLFVIDDGAEPNVTYPVDQAQRAKVISALTEALRYILALRRGTLDNEL